MHNSASILIVEDESTDALLIKRALKRACPDIEISIASDGPGALAHIMAGATDAIPQPLPTCILLDLKLHELDGLDVLRVLKSKESTRRLPVIIYSSSSDPEDVKTAYELGANSYVVKPVNNDELSGIAKRICEYWLLTNYSIQPFVIRP